MNSNSENSYLLENSSLLSYKKLFVQMKNHSFHVVVHNYTPIRLALTLFIVSISVLFLFFYPRHVFLFDIGKQTKSIVKFNITTAVSSGKLEYSRSKSTYIRKSCFNQTDNSTQVFTDVTRKTITYWDRNDIVLVIHFNHDYYQHRFSFLSLYQTLFPVVLFTGPGLHPQIIHCPEAVHQAYHCLARAIHLCPNHGGYLMAHFDLLPIFHNLEQLNLNSMWLPDIAFTDEVNAVGWHWGMDIGKKAFLLFMAELEELSRNSSRYLKYLTNYQNRVQRKLPSAYSDMFYVPQRLTADWLQVTQLIFKYQIFLEIGLPLSAKLLCSSKEDLVVIAGEPWNARPPNDTLYLDPKIEFYHRIDHTNPAHQHFLKILVNNSILSKNSSNYL